MIVGEIVTENEIPSEESAPMGVASSVAHYLRFKFSVRYREQLEYRARLDRAMIDIACVTANDRIARYFTELCKGSAVSIMINGLHQETHVDILDRVVLQCVELLAKGISVKSVEVLIQDTDNYLKLCRMEAKSD